MPTERTDRQHFRVAPDDLKSDDNFSSLPFLDRFLVAFWENTMESYLAPNPFSSPAGITQSALRDVSLSDR